MGSSPMWWSASPPSPWGRGAGKWWALGGPLAVKAVGFLLLAGLLFRVLCSFPSSRAPALQITEVEGHPTSTRFQDSLGKRFE
jgi:hypothetical protein